MATVISFPDNFERLACPLCESKMYLSAKHEAALCTNSSCLLHRSGVSQDVITAFNAVKKSERMAGHQQALDEVVESIRRSDFHGAKSSC